MAKFISFICIIFLSLCSFVDSSLVDVYTGSISYLGSDYVVTDLSGSIQYYLTDYDDISLDSNGMLYNIGSNTIYGCASIGGTDYSIRLNSLSGLQIQQSYYTNGYLRSVWIDYDLVPHQLPVSSDPAALYLILLVFFVILLVSSIFLRGE